MAESVVGCSDEIATEINIFRSDPSGYMVHLETHLKTFEDEMTYVQSDGRRVRTNEGKRGVQECIVALRDKPPMPLVAASALLEMAAIDHAKDQAVNNTTGHVGTDGSTMATRIEKYCKWQVTIGENCDYGNSDPRNIIIALLIDDGVENKGHRENLCNELFLFVGAAKGSHSTYKFNCVQDYAGGILDPSTLDLTDKTIVVPPCTSPLPEDLIIAIKSIPGGMGQQILDQIATKSAEGWKVPFFRN